MISDRTLACPRAHAKAWGVLYRWPNQISYTFRTWTRQGACMMAEEFCRRADHFYNIFLDSGVWDGTFVYTTPLARLRQSSKGVLQRDFSNLHHLRIERVVPAPITMVSKRWAPQLCHFCAHCRLTHSVLKF